MNVPQLRFEGFNKEWEKYFLKDISIVKDGTHDSPKYYSEGFPLITSKNLMKNGELDLENVSLINEKDFHEINKRSKVDDGDILFGMIGTIGNPVQVKSSNFAIKNVALIKEDKISNEYILHYLKSPSIYKQFHLNQAGGTQKFIGLGLIRDLTISVPQEKEIQKVTSFLSLLEKKYKKQQEKIENLEQFKKGMLLKLFSQELRFKDDSDQDYGEWDEKKIAQVLKIKHGRDQKKIENPNGKFPILATGGVIGRTDTFIYNRESVLIGRKGTIDKPVFMDTPFWTVDTLFYSEIKEGNSPKFLFYIFQHINWKLYNEASGVPSLSAKTIEAINIKIPKYEEQKKIANYLSVIDRKIEKEKEKLIILKEQKRGFVQGMFV